INDLHSCAGKVQENFQFLKPILGRRECECVGWLWSARCFSVVNRSAGVALLSKLRSRGIACVECRPFASEPIFEQGDKLRRRGGRFNSLAVAGCTQARISAKKQFWSQWCWHGAVTVFRSGAASPDDSSTDVEIR